MKKLELGSDKMESEKQFFYCNSLEIGVSQFDFSLKFIRQGTPVNSKAGNVTPERVAELTVVMSPAHAKAMLPGFLKAVNDYEKNIGKIAVDKAIQNKFDETFNTINKK
ncbi:MAG: DUF3467 domain-containing protein [Candidatus Nitrotoga sp.]|nr:DUF3467 domain-containing protein [Candidatus Nitrotoga sp.]MDP1855114.1 DUF3467 domain-containing protein [Candidatus Nitrotoga sp.]